MRRLFALVALASVIMPMAIASVGPSTRVPPAVQATTRSIRGDFTNEVMQGGASGSIAIFGGHVGAYVAPGVGGSAVVPSGASYELVSSAFGQAVAVDLPYQGFIEQALQDARELLYYEHAPDPDTAAFRYLALLYARDGADAAQRVRAQFETMDSLWGDPERAVVAQAEIILRDALKMAPSDRRLRTALLDLF